MKEVKEWDNNPRMMWVWDNGFEDKKEKKRVVYINPKLMFGVVTDDAELYAHCAEIEGMEMATHRQLARWLREKSCRELRYGDIVYSSHHYDVSEEDKPIEAAMWVREGAGPWMVPFKDALEALG